MKTTEMQYKSTERVAELINILIPGVESRWPSAFSSIIEIDHLYESLGTEADYIKILAADIADLPTDAREEAVAAREATDGAIFQRMLAVLYRLYYTSPPVLAVVAALADAGPREPSAHVDPTLVAQVLARRPGQRRLGP